jgi:hypothetical protein
VTLIPRLPRPEWVEEILAELRKIPDAVRMARTIGAEQQKTHQIRESRNVALEELRKAQTQIADLEKKIVDMEQILIKHLKGGT